MSARPEGETSTFALLADIHANVWALEAVLADVDRRGITRLYDLGDSLYGPLDPAATADLLLERDVPSIRGNGDRLLLAEPRPPAYQASAERLAPRHLDWLRALPETRVVLDDVLLCHGTPGSDTTYLLEPPTGEGGRLRPREEIAQDLAGVPQRLVCCGHSHIPRVVALAGGTLIVNPGSVGLPAYDDDTPAPHVMESHTPHAKYAILTRREGTWAVELIQVPYDWARAAARATALGRPDWAAALASGWRY
ncbi:MAG TPA: metallophosphoesterase family protein [Thermomicrobiales bacterium]|nr:metallophosphoesterase family protein [Thermomicrobiales bacterium]